jgi:hypothetical protein
MKPGDFIEWTYKYYNTLVSQDETLWSTLECCPVPIGAAALLVWITDKEYAWLTPGCSTHAGMIRGRPSVRSVGSGLFHAHAGGGQERHGMWVVPRTQG